MGFFLGLNGIDFGDLWDFFLKIPSVRGKKDRERIGTRMTQILRIYTDFFEFILKIQHKFKKIRVNP
ncbi:MAG: hypothetical protein RLZZ628_4024 [Bacteroidota bacterium]|jgi:hypothetical protein